MYPDVRASHIATCLALFLIITYYFFFPSPKSNIKKTGNESAVQNRVK